LELNGIQGIIKVEERASVTITPIHDRVSFVRWISEMRRTLFRVIDELHDARHASFLKGVILGYRGDITLDVKQSFIDTGTIHILAVSGSNVAVVVLIFLAVFRLFRLSQTWLTLLTIVGLIWYMVITGFSFHSVLYSQLSTSIPFSLESSTAFQSVSL
jgi:competence protein ComEC